MADAAYVREVKKTIAACSNVIYNPIFVEAVIQTVPNYIRYIAVLLLMLFTRAMVPDALLLELHAHKHSIHASHNTDSHKAQVGEKHKHCPVEDLFGAPCQGTITVLKSNLLLHKTAYASHYQYSGYRSSTTFFYLRGPPVA